MLLDLLFKHITNVSVLLEGEIRCVKNVSIIKVVGDSCQKITLLLLKRKSVRVIVPESCF